MPSILDYYKYAKLATAAYVNLDGQALTESTIASLASAQNRLPRALANQTFDPGSTEGAGQPVWTIPAGGYFGNDSTGFAAPCSCRAPRKQA